MGNKTQKKAWGMSLQGVPCKDRLKKHCDPDMTACTWVPGSDGNKGYCRSKPKD